MIIKMQLKDIIKDDKLVKQLGLNPYCLREEADGDTWYEIDTEYKEIPTTIELDRETANSLFDALKTIIYLGEKHIDKLIANKGKISAPELDDDPIAQMRNASTELLHLTNDHVKIRQ